MSNLIFNEYPEFTIATNRFVNCPVILQYDDTPLIEMVRDVDASYTTQISIYHSDGTYLTKAKGTQLYDTELGKKAGVSMSFPDGMSVCKMGSKILFELRREQAAALKGSAELYAPGGAFIRAVEYGVSAEVMDQRHADHLLIDGTYMKHQLFKNFRIGIHIQSSGTGRAAGIPLVDFGVY